MRLITRAAVHDLFLLLAMALAMHATPALLATGACLWAVGVALQVWSKAALKRNTSLATSGPYALCRHPFYLANAIFDLGLCVMSGSPWLIALYPFVFYVGYAPTIRKEEAELTRLFGDAYPDYRRTTGRIFPRSLRVLRDWRCEASWGNLRAERQISRTVRYSAFPLLVWLAARVWARPDDAADPANLAIFSGAAALVVVGYVMFRFYEGRPGTHPFQRISAALARFAAPACAALFAAVVVVREIEAEDLLLAAALSFLLLGWSLLAALGGTLARKHTRFSRVLSHGGAIAIAAYGLFVLESLWALPLALGLLVSAAFIPTERSWTARSAPAIRLAAGAALFAFGVGGLFLLHNSWTQFHELTPIRTALAEETRDGDLVLLLRDRELEVLLGTPRVDGEITGDELGLLARARTPQRRLFVLAEDDDMHSIPGPVLKTLRVRRAFRLGFDTFYLLEVRPSAGA